MVGKALAYHEFVNQQNSCPDRLSELHTEGHRSGRTFGSPLPVRNHIAACPVGVELSGGVLEEGTKLKERGLWTEAVKQAQQDLGTEADVIIESSHLHTSLIAAAAQSKDDLMVIGHLPTDGHLGENGSRYSIIRASHVPVLSL